MTASPDPLRLMDKSIQGTAGMRAAETPAGPPRPSAGGAPPGRVPDFFIVGHQKCGTTALYLMLRSHPEIFMSDVKEPQFFATDQRSPFASRRASSAKRPRTLDAYLSLFAAAAPEQLVGEASPQYLRSETAARGIAALQPAARIVAILREPASFLRSFHLQMVSSRIETETDFAKAIAREDDRRAGKRIPRRCHHPDALLYSDHVRYVEQLRRYYEVFPSEQVLVLVYEDFRRDNEATVRTVRRFLGVDDAHPVATLDTKPLNAVRFMTAHQLLGMGRRARNNPSAATRLERAMNVITPTVLRNELFRKRWHRMIYTRPAPPDEQLMLELRRRFKPEVEALSEYLGRDLASLWGYDRLG
jgi:Sulfotransferase domain